MNVDKFSSYKRRFWGLLFALSAAFLMWGIVPDKAFAQDDDHTLKVYECSFGMRLYKGDTTFIDICKKSADKVEVSSSDKDVVSINLKGKITAKKCGRATVFIHLVSEECIRDISLEIKVEYCSYDSKSSQGSGIKRNSNSVSVKVYNEMRKGGKVSFSIDPDMSIKSSKPSVVSIKDGMIYAQKKGDSNVTVSLDKEGSTVKICTIKVTVKNKKKLKPKVAQKDAFFKNSLFTGNSLGIGFRYYCDNKYKSFLGNVINISAKSYSFMNDLSKVTSSSLHPTYHGKKKKVKDHVKDIKPKHIILHYGMNDLNIYGVLGSADHYKSFIKNLEKVDKDAHFYIMAMTPVMQNKGRLNYTDIKKFNKYLKKYAATKDNVTFIDVFTPLLEKGTTRLKKSYCSDGFCHLTFAAYDVWRDKLYEYAAKQIVINTKANDAYHTVKDTLSEEDYENASKLVNKMQAGRDRNKLLKKLKKLKIRLEK